MLFGGKSNQILGLDIGTHTIKAVMLEHHHRGPRVVKAGMREIRGEAPYEPKKLRRAETVLALRELLSELRISPAKVRNLVTAIGGPATSMKEISTVQMSEEELSSSLIFEARKHLPLDDSDTVIDHQMLGEDPEDPQKVRILLVATTRKMYGWHESVLKDLGFRPGIVDLDPLAVINSYTIGTPLPDEGLMLLLNMGARGTNFIVTGRKGRVFNRDIPIGGYHFSADLAKKQSINFDEAEQRKRSEGVEAFHGASAAGGESALALQMRTVLEDFLDEIRRTLRYYVKESGQSDFEHVKLCGGSARLKGLDALIAEKFNLSVEAWDPLADLEGSDTVNGGSGPQYAQCVGQALRRE